MRTLINRCLAWLIDHGLYFFVAFITGIRPKFEGALDFTPEKKVYFANHGSHGDFVMVWISLPKRWRRLARPVAGADYWLTNRFKRFIINNVFNGLLIMRNGSDPKAITAQMGAALDQGSSLIIFPEGTRNTDDDVLLLPFKSGIYHLARENPDVGFIPIWIQRQAAAGAAGVRSEHRRGNAAFAGRRQRSLSRTHPQRAAGFGARRQTPGLPAA